MFKIGACPVEEHDTHGFRVFADAERTDGGDAHEEILIENMTLCQVFQSGGQHIPAQNQIGGHAAADHGPFQAETVKDQAEDEQTGTQQDTGQAACAVFVTVPAVMVFPVVMMLTAAAAVMRIMVMVMTAAAFMLFVVMVMSAAAFMLLMVMMMSAAAAVFLLRCCLPGTDLHTAFHCPGDLCQIRNQRIRIRGGEPQLPGGKGDNRFLHCRMGIEFAFDLGRAVGAVQIFEDVYLTGHPEYLLISTYEQTLICFSFSIYGYRLAVKNQKSFFWGSE